MVRISNSPNESTLIKAEARKSLSFGLLIRDEAGAAIDVSASEFKLTVGKTNRDMSVDSVLIVTAQQVDPVNGYVRFEVQAAALDLPARTYDHVVVMTTTGYSAVILKGDFEVSANVEFESIFDSFPANGAAPALEVVLRNQGDVIVTVSDYTPATPISSDLAALQEEIDDLEEYVDQQDSSMLLAAQAYTDQEVAQALIDADASADAALAAFVAFQDTRDDAQDSLIATKASTTAMNAGDAATLSSAQTYATNAVAAAHPYTLTVKSLTALGQPVVTISAVDITITDYPALWIPTPGDRVVVEQKNGGGYAITSQHKDYIEFPRRNPGIYVIYSDNNTASNSFGGGPRAYLRNGFVQLSGLLALSASAAGTVLMTLPVGMRPDTTRVFASDNSGVCRTIFVKADGTVQLGQGFTVNGFTTLDNIIFPVSGRATWIDVQPQGTAGNVAKFLNGWKNFLDPTVSEYGKVAYWIDEYGFVWWRGMIAGGTAGDNVAMIQMPTGTFGAVEIHERTCSADTAGGVHVGLAGTPDTVNMKLPSSSAWISMAPVTFATVTAMANTGWKTAGVDYVYSNSWVSYNAPQYPPFMFLQRNDGLVFLRGLIKGGGFNAQLAAGLPPSTWKDATTIYAALSAAAHGRVDQYGVGPAVALSNQAGAMHPQSGSNVWFSLDGIKWIPD